MARTWTALKVTPGITYVDANGNPMRADDTGIVYCLAAQSAAMTAQAAPPSGLAPILATAAHFTGTKHAGSPLSWTTEG